LNSESPVYQNLNSKQQTTETNTRVEGTSTFNSSSYTSIHVYQHNYAKEK